MRTFFLQLFLTFWVATIGIFIAATIFFPNQDHGSPEILHAAAAASAEKLTEFTVAAYRLRGCSGIANLGSDFVLTNENGKPLCGGKLSEQEHEVAMYANQTGADAGRLIDTVFLQAYEVTDSTGEKWVLLQRLRDGERSWFPRLPKSALPMSIAVTFCFALLLTRPVRALSLAFRRFSDGDLAVRLSVSRRRWSGVGGADMRSLMLDFNHMADRVSELVDAQKLLVRDISHELRSPLARLRLALEMTREESPTELPSLDRMELEAERLNELVGQMLTLSLMESTKDIVNVDSFKVDDLLEEMLPDMEFEASARSCSVTLRISTEQATLIGNRELMRRAVENVIRNAIRFTATGTAVEVDLDKHLPLPIGKEPSKTEAEAISIRVSDRGPGVPEANVPLLFRAFYRTDTARRDSTGGFGVGLSIAERAVHLHHGVIRAANRVGGGLTVEIVLPVV